ncbi:hypothetical protein Salmuc_02593 [Salipiger mucosus DSM 16094]|uniref:Uncharacterized protein n=1 Tax=Salipiger mucosus DSM 16094 TaxID=1123237 RepID=S9SG05_9RHOB|nr:hypothetical protein Salmuc_02593 [Salipiger mucosus DSM 16094]
MRRQIARQQGQRLDQQVHPVPIQERAHEAEDAAVPQPQPGAQRLAVGRVEGLERHAVAHQPQLVLGHPLGDQPVPHRVGGRHDHGRGLGLRHQQPVREARQAGPDLGFLRAWRTVVQHQRQPGHPRRHGARDRAIHLRLHDDLGALVLRRARDLLSEGPRIRLPADVAQRQRDGPWQHAPQRTAIARDHRRRGARRAGTARAFDDLHHVPGPPQRLNEMPRAHHVAAGRAQAFTPGGDAPGHLHRAGPAGRAAPPAVSARNGAPRSLVLDMIPGHPC